MNIAMGRASAKVGPSAAPDAALTEIGMAADWRASKTASGIGGVTPMGTLDARALGSINK